MKEIKFRAWDKVNQEYIYFDFSNIYGYEGEISGVLLPDGNTLLNDNEKINENLIIEQFTGLHDKNGKEIYEGDILEFVLNTKYGLIHKRGVMDWDGINPWVGFLPKHNGEQQGLYILDFSVEGWNRKVIGNIYENPELLEQA